MDRPIDDNVLAVLDDYWETLHREDASESLTARSRPTVTDGETQRFFQLLEELDDARRMLKEDSRCQFNETTRLPDETPALPETFGRYQIQRQLGQGGMGAVFLVHDTQLERDVALKVPQFSRADDKGVRERFLREARAAATLNHANICPVYDVGEIEGIPHLTMAFIDGQPLTCRGIDSDPDGEPVGEISPLASPAASALTSRQRDRDAAILIRKVALALDHAHHKGVVHRDLKPGNIMLDRRGEPIVVDFGLARRMEVQDTTLTRRGVILGSLAYMSPEQALGEHERVGPASDIYSLGVILYELLTGQLPYSGRRSGVLGHIISSEPVDLAHRSDLDPDLRAICAKALAKRAEERFASMAEFATALQDYLDGTGETQGVCTASASLASRLRFGIFSGTVLLLAMFGVALAGLVVIQLQTADGTLVVEVNEPGAKVTVVNEEGVVEVARASDGGTLKLSVDPGKHRLKVEKDGFAVFAKEFSIASGQMQSIRATLVFPPAKSAAENSRDKPDSLPPPSSLPDSSSLIAWWSGNGNAEDSVGRNHGIPHGVSFAPGMSGQAFNFDGIDDFIRVPNSDALNPKSEFTIEFWICPNSSGGFRNILGKWDMHTRDFSYVVQQAGNRPKLYLAERGHLDLAEMTARQSMKSGVWLHFAATFDTNTVRLYWNGWLDAVKSVGTNRRIHAGAADVFIGAGNKGTLLNFSGLIDEVKLYDRALSNAEIRAIYRASSGGQARTVSPDIELYEDIEQIAELANNSLHAKDYATSAVLWKETWQGRQVTRGPHHYQTADAENLLGESLAKQSKFNEAERHLLDSYAAVPHAKGFPSNWIPIYERRLVDLYEAWGKPAEAEKWRAKWNKSNR